MPCLLPIIVRAKAHSVVITNPSLKAGVNTKELRQLYTRSVHHKSQPKGWGNGRMVWTQATGSLVTNDRKFGHKRPEVWSQATRSLVTSDQKFGHKRPEVWSQATRSLVTSDQKF